MAVDTLHGTTIAFATTSFTANFNQIGGTEESREAIETTHLGTTDYRTFAVGDLVDPGGFDAEFQWNPSFGTFPPISSAAETITITFPLASGEVTNATLAGTGFLTSAKGGDAVRNATDLAVGTLTVKWSDQATYTAGS